MSTVTAPRITPIPAKSLRLSVKVIAAAIVVVAAAVALTVWLLVKSPAHHATTTAPPLTNVQKVGVAGQSGPDVCHPAASQRYC
jgi:hypothetical protein